MTEPKVVNAFRDYTHNGTMPSERRSILIGVCDHIDRLAARVQELEQLATVNLSDYTDLVAEKAQLAARVQELEEYVEQLKGEIRDIIELEGLP